MPETTIKWLGIAYFEGIEMISSILLIYEALNIDHNRMNESKTIRIGPNTSNLKAKQFLISFWNSVILSEDVTKSAQQFQQRAEI